MRPGLGRGLGGPVIASTLATMSCTASGQTPERGAGGHKDVSSAVPVETATVEQRSMPLAIHVIGSAEAYSNVAVHPQITGQLTSVDFKEGDDVH